MGRAKDANGDLAAIGDHQLAKRGHRTTPPRIQILDCGLERSLGVSESELIDSTFQNHSKIETQNRKLPQVSASTGFSSIPIGTIVARTRSPGLRNVPVAEPTP